MKEVLSLKTKFNKITTSQNKFESAMLYFYLDDDSDNIFIFNALNAHILKYKKTQLTDFDKTKLNQKVYNNATLSEVFDEFIDNLAEILNNTISKVKSKIQIIKQCNSALENNFSEYLI